MYDPKLSTRSAPGHGLRNHLIHAEQTFRPGAGFKVANGHRATGQLALQKFSDLAPVNLGHVRSFSLGHIAAIIDLRIPSDSR
jgi:hypothetical protein